ncbi:MAG: hypothetical protein ISS69_07375 [Phycisphaerae bacterium]|nr:hypothetical protein [Phycisphaerae bacterium]
MLTIALAGLIAPCANPDAEAQTALHAALAPETASQVWSTVDDWLL